MRNIFDIEYTLFTVWGYPMSLIEFSGTLAGVVAVWLISKANIWGWPIGLVNIILYFFLFFQVRLYPDMGLQVFYLITNLIGWWRWAHPKSEEADAHNELKITWLSPRIQLVLCILIFLGTLLVSYPARFVHEWIPTIFKHPGAFPWTDSLVFVVSVVATYLMIEKKVEGWICWIIVDSIACCIYYLREIKFVALVYLVFCFIALFGLYHWIKIQKSYKNPIRNDKNLFFDLPD